MYATVPTHNGPNLLLDHLEVHYHLAPRDMHEEIGGHLQGL
jgi:hypothetical protein